MDTNPLRLSNGETTLIGSYTAGEIMLGLHTPTSKFTSSTRVNQGFYDDSDFDSTDVHETLSLSTRNERWSAGIEGMIDYDTTRSSEISSLGVTVPSIRHTGLSAEPEVAYKLTEQDTVSLKGKIVESRYDHNAYVDYRVYSLSPSYMRNIDPLNILLMSINSRRYQTQDGPDTTVDNIGPQLGWQTVISPRLVARLTAGAERSTRDSVGTASDSSQINYVFAGYASYNGEQDMINFVVSRAQQPFGNGSSTLVTTFTIDETYKVNETLSFAAGARYRMADTSSLGGVNLKDERSCNVGFSYAIYDQLDITGSYRYLSQSLTNSGSVSAHAVMFGLTFHPYEWDL